MINTDFNYDRKTINLVFELKRSLPLDKQADIKLTNPNLIAKIKEIYQAEPSAKSKELAERLLEAAGIPIKEEGKGFLNAIMPAERSGQSSYRGQSVAEQSPLNKQSKYKHVKMFRGQVVK